MLETWSSPKPVGGTVRIYLDSVKQRSGWSVDVTGGIVTFSTPPATGVDVTAGFVFDVPVRFDTDHMAVTIENLGKAKEGDRDLEDEGDCADQGRKSQDQPCHHPLPSRVVLGELRAAATLIDGAAEPVRASQ